MMNSNKNTPAALAGKAMSAASQNASALGVKREAALSSFRATVNQLKEVNTQLDEDIAMAEKMISFYQTQKDEAVQLKADNDAVASKILEIIGE